MKRLIAALVETLPAGERCLEIGVGTGRIALPLAERGIHVMGVDISLEMLRKLAGRRSGPWPQAAVGDATQLPFRAAGFGSAVASHVLHLVPDWKLAVAEITRVVRPGGVLVASRGSHLTGGWRDQVSRRFFQEAGNPPWPPGMDRIEELDAEMESIGAVVMPFPDLMRDEVASVESMIGSMEAGIWAACWSLDDGTRRRAAAATRRWAIGELGDLSAPRPARSGSVWRSYRLPEQR